MEQKAFHLTTSLSKITRTSSIQKHILTALVPFIPQLICVWCRRGCSPNKWKSHSATTTVALYSLTRLRCSFSDSTWNVEPPKDPLFFFSSLPLYGSSWCMFVSKTHGFPSQLLSFRQARCGEGEPAEHFLGLSAALRSLERSVWTLEDVWVQGFPRGSILAQI